MTMCDRTPVVDLENLRAGDPPGMPLYDSEHIEELCKRWVSYEPGVRERIIGAVMPLVIYDRSEDRRAVVNVLASKHLTQLAKPVRGYRRLGNNQIDKIWRAVQVTSVG